MSRVAALAEAVLDRGRTQGLMVATAESCTGGLIAAALTDVPGASRVFDRGFVAYSNLAKRQLLAVPEPLLLEYGAVSEEVARAMAEGALAGSTAGAAVSVTGIAGPGGGSERKPVGTVVFARAERGDAPDKMVADKREFGDIGRSAVRVQAALCALELLMPSTADEAGVP